MKSDEITIAIAGNPNTGKSTIFNALTGLHQKTGNFPGVTIEKKTGNVRMHFGRQSANFRFIDLPGTYCLFPKSIDELETYKALTNKRGPEYPDKVLVIADASNLQRSLLLCLQIIELQLPVVLAVNMIDLLDRSNLSLDTKKLSERLGVPVIAVNAREKKGLERIKQALLSDIPVSIKPSRIFSMPGWASELKTVLNSESDFQAWLMAANYPILSGNNELPDLNGFLKKYGTSPFQIQTDYSLSYYQEIKEITNDCLSQMKETRAMVITRKMDNILTHPIGGFILFLTTLFLIFQAVFSWSELPMNIIDRFFRFAGTYISENLPPGLFNDLLAKGILPGLGGIMMFIPQIAILFGFIAILEDSGYMARVSFIMDKMLRPFGLNGKSIIPMISGVACAVPSVMSARTIKNTKERLLTILVTPLMSCSARIPVYTLLISFALPNEAEIGLFSLRAVALMGLYLIGFLAALLAALCLKFIIKSKEKSYFIMELPVYRIPDWPVVLNTIYTKVRVFAFDAGKIIVAISIVLFVLSSYGPGNRFAEIEKKYTSQDTLRIMGSENAAQALSSEKLKNSYAGIMGKTIEPLISPLGFDWKIGISLITSLAAREVFVGTMATIYGSEATDEPTESLKEKMQKDRNEFSGKPLFSRATAFSLIIFYAFAMQCISTMVVVGKETGSLKWPIIQFAFMGALAWIASFMVYQFMS